MTTTNCQTDWKKCCLCQEDKNEDLKCPTTRYQPEHDGYAMLATNVPLFHALNDMPLILDPARLDEGAGIEETLRKNKAVYHQSCRYLFNNTKLERAKKRKSADESTLKAEGSTSTKVRRASHEAQKSECFLCEEIEPAAQLRQAMTMNLSQRVNECARTLNDGKLLAKLSGGDAIAQELKYHPACLAGFYNRVRAQKNAEERQLHTSVEHGVYPLAFSELITYIVETSTSSESPSVFRLADLVQLYKERLEQLGAKQPNVNSTRLKERILDELPEMEAHKEGRDVLLAFHKDIGSALAQVSDYSEAMALAKAAKILRRHILEHKTSFNGTFHEGCVQEAIPSALLQFVSMIEHGADIKSQLRFGTSKTDLAIAQLLQYNCYGTQILKE